MRSWTAAVLLVCASSSTTITFAYLAWSALLKGEHHSRWHWNHYNEHLFEVVMLTVMAVLLPWAWWVIIGNYRQRKEATDE